MKRYRDSKKLNAPQFEVRLNVGGKILCTQANTLRRNKSILKEAVDDPDPFVKDKFENLLVDVNPIPFQIILDWMRTGIFPETLCPGLPNYLYENVLDVANELEVEDLLVELDYQNFVDHGFCILEVYGVYRVFVLTTDSYRKYNTFDVNFKEDHAEIMAPNGHYTVVKGEFEGGKEREMIKNFVLKK